MLVLVGTQPFKVQSASRNVTAARADTPEKTWSASYVFFNAFINGEADVPAAILAGDVTLNIVINRSGEYSSDSVVIARDDTNTSLADLVVDINASLLLDGFGDITASLEGNRLGVHEPVRFHDSGQLVGCGSAGPDHGCRRDRCGVVPPGVPI